MNTSWSVENFLNKARHPNFYFKKISIFDLIFKTHGKHTINKIENKLGKYLQCR